MVSERYANVQEILLNRLERQNAVNREPTFGLCEAVLEKLCWKRNGGISGKARTSV